MADAPVETTCECGLDQCEVRGSWSKDSSSYTAKCQHRTRAITETEYFDALVRRAGVTSAATDSARVWTRMTEAIDLLLRAQEALRLTREYVGEHVLPPIAGWSWFDASAAIADWCSEFGIEVWDPRVPNVVRARPEPSDDDGVSPGTPEVLT